MEAITDKREYPAGESLEVSVQNNLGKTICFSSCYPYFVQKAVGKTGDWQPYKYGKCPNADITTSCIGDKKFKEFRLLLKYAEIGTNRLMIPVCRGCAAGQEFKQDAAIYSNTFEVR